ncbi:hypothetical protein BTVI_34911 [Pitangus sulphuratus]|nr:hypothetical protein BTVI_34911 [Pitangus sulphuratus]
MAAAAAARWPWALLCLAAAPLLSPAAAGLSCCYHAKENLMCRDVCEQILSSKSDSRLKHLLQRAPEYCPESMREVWACINSSLPGVLKKSDGWVGLGCCELAIAVECRQACKQEVGQYGLKENVRGKLSAILFIFLYKEGLYCCDRAEDYACQTACKRILMSMKTELEIVDGLIEGCKTMPLPQDPLWQCFLESSRSVHPGVTVHPPPSTGLDGAKLHCCSKANSSTCRELCTKLYSTSWGNSQSWQEFDRFCEYNAVEVSMLTCLADVREPCQLGCRNLTYCTNFNNRSDCVEILKKCGDHNKFPEGHSAESICELLSPTDDLENCIPLDTYLSCKLGEASDFIVRQGTLIQVPSSAGDVGCYKICTCGHSGLLENCMEMRCVDLQKSCIVGGQRKSLPCNCVDQFVPVCGQNGRTYPSACIARCVGLQDNQFEFGSCISKDPCNPNPCNKNQRCIPKKQVCLTSFEKFECSQHECVPRQLNCDQTRDPVCDTDNVEYSNLCTLYQKGKSLAYRGPCQPFCKSVEPVCGHNGETYSSVCAAYSDRVAVDYHGHCQAVGVLSDYGFHMECAFVKCPQLSATGCKPVIAPGTDVYLSSQSSSFLVTLGTGSAAVKQCQLVGLLCLFFPSMGAQVAVTDNHLHYFEVTNKKPITVLDILEKIRLHVSVPQCDVFGYLSIESEIVILIIPVDQNPKPLQEALEAFMGANKNMAIRAASEYPAIAGMSQEQPSASTADHYMKFSSSGIRKYPPKSTQGCPKNVILQHLNWHVAFECFLRRISDIEDSPPCGFWDSQHWLQHEQTVFAPNTPSYMHRVSD